VGTIPASAAPRDLTLVPSSNPQQLSHDPTRHLHAILIEQVVSPSSSTGSNGECAPRSDPPSTNGTFS
jgi:Cyclin, N-terminal domain